MYLYSQYSGRPSRKEYSLPTRPGRCKPAFLIAVSRLRCVSSRTLFILPPFHSSALRAASLQSSANECEPQRCDKPSSSSSPYFSARRIRRTSFVPNPAFRLLTNVACHSYPGSSSSTSPEASYAPGRHRSGCSSVSQKIPATTSPGCLDHTHQSEGLGPYAKPSTPVQSSL